MTFDETVAAFLVSEYENSPTRATALGVDGYDDLLPDLSAEAHLRRDAEVDSWLSTFEAFADADLTAEEQIDRDLAISSLRGRQLVREWADWRRNADEYVAAGLDGVFLLFLHRLRPEPELAAAAESRLLGVPALLDAARANLDLTLASPLLLQRSARQALAGARYARDLVPNEVGDARGRLRLAAAGEVAGRAYADFANWLNKVAPGATGSFAIGEDLYSALLREREGLGYGARELRERGRSAYNDLEKDLRSRAMSLAGHTEWREVLESFNAEHPATPDAMREGYARWTAQARQFCKDRELVTMPRGEECRVVPSPAFQRPVLAVASYARPPAFRPGVIGHFFVPYPPDGTPAGEVQQRLATNGWHSMPTISVHEAYPGHHWHLTWAQTVARPLRQVLGTPYFTEGWALYAEEMLRREGFFPDPRAEMCQVDARIFRAARIVVDTSLHMGEMTVDEAVDFMSTKASLSEPTARAEVTRYCAWPTQASSYLTGALEIDRIRGEWEKQKKGTLREFHDVIAGSGSLPLALAERAVLG